jgi:transposase
VRAGLLPVLSTLPAVRATPTTSEERAACPPSQTAMTFVWSPATVRGYRRLTGWVTGFGEVLAVGVEGTGSWGAGLSRHLRGRGLNVVEVNKPNRHNRRRRGKTDPIDAEAAARAVLAGDATATPKAGDGPVEALRQLRVARAGALNS